MAIRGSAIGVVAWGAVSLELHGLWVHDNGTRGINIEDTLGPTSAAVSSSLLEHNHELGVVVIGSDAQLLGVSIVDTLARPVDGIFGDGVVVASWGPEATAELSSCHIGRSARVGLGVFGAAASIHASRLSCNGIQLARETFDGRTAVLTDAGGNRCSCSEEEHPCQALSVGLEPPEPLDPVEWPLPTRVLRQPHPPHQFLPLRLAARRHRAEPRAEGQAGPEQERATGTRSAEVWCR